MVYSNIFSFAICVAIMTGYRWQVSKLLKKHTCMSCLMVMTCMKVYMRKQSSQYTLIKVIYESIPCKILTLTQLKQRNRTKIT